MQVLLGFFPLQLLSQQSPLLVHESPFGAQLAVGDLVVGDEVGFPVTGDDVGASVGLLEGDEDWPLRKVNDSTPDPGLR